MSAPAKSILVLVALCLSCASHGTGTKASPSAQAAPPPPPPPPAEEAPPEIRLVLWLTIDQMRGDFFERYGHHMGDGGMKRLLDAGLSYTATTHRHAITETAPGHATLFTGAAPREHGIIANSWLLPNGEKTFSVSDGAAPLLGAGTENANVEEGRSPKLLLVPTIGDAMVRQSEGRAKVVSISIKDRGAILPAGQSGKAFWLGEKGFVTSEYYYDRVPSWLAEHTTKKPLPTYLPKQWNLLKDRTAYRTSATPVPPSPALFGAGFPHELPLDELGAQKLLKLTPFGDQATLDLAKTALVANGLGTDEQADLLAVSLSATDGIGHAWGPSSREAEDNFARLDRSLADFFEFVDSKVDWAHVLVVFSSDHGGAEPAAQLQKLGLRGLRFGEEALQEKARELSKRSFQDSDFILGVQTPYVTLDHEAIEASGHASAPVRRELAARLSELPQVHEAYALGEDHGIGPLPDQIRRALHPARSGDIYVVPQPYTLLLQDEELVATHGSPWSYDAHVPLVIAGPEVPHGRVGRSADTRSIAGTVAALLDITPPSAAQRALLVEALRPHFAGH